MFICQYIRTYWLTLHPGRINIHVFHRKPTALMRNGSGDGKGDKPLHIFGPRKAFLPNEGAWASYGPGDFIFQWSNLGPPEENHCS